jgi:hypothetical protein
MLESLRHYAREHLDTDGLADETRRCHARHFTAAVAAMSPGLRGPDAILWRERLDADLDNFRAAVTWALGSAVEEDGDLAMVILGEPKAAVRGDVINLFAGVDYQRVVEQARRSASPYASLAIADAANNALHRGNLSQGRELSREAMQGVRMSPYPTEVLVTSLAFVESENLAMELTDALQILDEVGADLWQYAQLRGVAAVMAALFGNLILARHEAALAMECSRRVGNPTLLGLAAYGFALASWQSDPIAAQGALEEQVPMIRAVGDSEIVPRALALLSHLRAGGSDHSGALEALWEGLECAHVNGDRPALAVCLARGAVVMKAVGDHHSAAVFLGAMTSSVRARRSGVSPNEIPDYNQFVTTLRSHLGDDRYRAATARGAAMTYEQITAFALAAVEHLRQN